MNSNNFIIKLLTEKLEIGIEIKDQAEDIISFASESAQADFIKNVAERFNCSITPDLNLLPESQSMVFSVKNLDNSKFFDIMFEFQKKFGSEFDVRRNYFKVIY